MELFISGFISLLITVLSLFVNARLQSRARKHEFELVTYESLEEENKELRTTNFRLQQEILEHKSHISKLDHEMRQLQAEKEELVSKLNQLTKDLLASRESEFKLFSEIGLLKKLMDEQREIIEELKAKID